MPIVGAVSTFEAVTLPLPEPKSLYRGVWEQAWGLVRIGRLRRAASTLASVDPGSLDLPAQAQQLALLTTCRLGLGDVASAAVSSEDLERLRDAGGVAEVVAALAAGELAAALGDHGAAVTHYRHAGSRELSADPDLPSWRAGAVIALIRTGSRSEAVDLARELMQVAEDETSPHHLAVAMRTMATADPQIDTLTTLSRARGLAAHSDDLRLIAQIDTDIAGQVLLEPAGDFTQAIATLREAEAFSATEGLWPLHARVTRILERAGERSSPLPTERSTMLTNAEHRVANLAAQGLTNRQIAEQLSVTIKGVEWHLSRVYRKLGISSRAGLGAVLNVAAKPRSASA